MRRAWLFRLLSLLLASGVFLAAAEGIFRVFIHPSDIPHWTTDPNLGYRLEAGQEGVFSAAGHRARYHLNNRGWNSPRDYSPERIPGITRIAVVGDSYVEAFQVDIGQSLGPELEKLLKSKGRDVEVYTYGVSGASSAYAYRLIRGEVLEDRPDVIVYLFINNDVSDSVPYLHPREGYQPTYTLSESGQLHEEPLTPYRPKPVKRLLSHLALFRYFWVDRGLGTAMERFTNTVPPQGDAALQDPAQAGIYDDVTPPWEKAWTVTGLLIQAMSEVSKAHGIDFFVINKPHAANFSSTQIRGDPNRPERELAKQAASRGFDFIDLLPWFRQDYDLKKKRFDYPGDAHWNEEGHLVAARALVDILAQRRPDLFASSVDGDR